MGFCCVKWCGKCSRTSNIQKDGISFFRFPKSPDLKAKWIASTQRGESWYPRNSTVICSRHFTADCFHQVSNQRRRLLDSAVPTLYLPVLAHTATDDNHTGKEAITTTPQENNDINVGASTSTNQVDEIKREDDNSAVVVQIISIQHCNKDSFEHQEEDSTLNNAKLMTASQQDNTLLQAPPRKRELFRDPDSPSAYDTPVEKRLCRRIMELKSKLTEKNFKLRKVRDSNRRLKRQIISLKSRLTEKEEEK